MITGEERDLFARSVDHSTASLTGHDLDGALAELGWFDALDVDPQTAVSLLFEAQGRAHAASSALDAVLTAAMQIDARMRVVLPRVGSVAPPGSQVDHSVRVAGLVTGPVRGPVAVVVADRGDGATLISVDGGELDVAEPAGMDRASSVARVDGVVGLGSSSPVDWDVAVAAGQRALAHELVGAATTMFTLAREHAIERVQFGQPIARFQAIRHKLADCHVAITSAEAALDGAWIDDTPLAAAVAKAVAGRAARLVAKHSQQVLAGIGFTLEHELHHHVRRVLLLEGLLGDTDSLTEAMGRELLRTRELRRALRCERTRNEENMTIRVVQWTTGNVGKSSVSAIVANPSYELIGCYAWSIGKVGRDVGELCGLDPIGVTATDDVDALLALEPDCVVYNPMWRDVDELVRILESGANVVATAAFITGTNLGPDRDRLVAACEKGGSTLFGTGISPGFVELFAMIAAGICERVDKITVSETANTTFYDSPDTERPAGFGMPIDDPDLEPMAQQGTAVFGEAVAMIGDGLGVTFDEIVCVPEYAAAVEDLEMESWTIPAGHVAGVAASWQGRVGDRVVVDLNVRWKKGERTEPDWTIERDGHVIEIQGLPTVTTTLDFLPPPDFEAETIEDFAVIGHIITAMPAVNAIGPVVDADPGIVTYNDIRLPGPRGTVRS